MSSDQKYPTTTMVASAAAPTIGIDALHGFMAGSVIIPDGTDLTVPVCDESFTNDAFCGADD